MTVDHGATHKTDSLADRAAGIVSHGDRAALSIGTMSDAGASSEGCGVPTPFYDLLTEMIQAHALENAHRRQHDNATGHDDVVPARTAGDGSAPDAKQDLHRVKVDTVPLVANHRWRVLTRRQHVGIASLIVAAAIGGVIFVSQVSVRQPLAVAYDPSKEGSPVVGAAGAKNEPAEGPLQAGEPGGLGTPGVERERSVEGGIRTSNMVAAHSDGRSGAPPVAALPIENLASDGENPRQVEGALEARSSSETTNSDSIAPPTSAPSNESLPQAAALSRSLVAKTEPTADPTKDTVAIRIARAIIQVNMRAGPSNDKAVVMRIPEGSPLEVVKCHHWCEVIFSGQRGWVYKGFIGLSPLASPQ